MSSTPFRIAAASSLMLLAGCVTAPTGPSTMALPGAGKSFDQFRADDADCRQYAQSQSGGADANQAAINSGLTSAAVGTAVGALAGAAIGGHQGAGAGAGTGLLFGTMAGTGAAQSSAHATQRNYDNAYTQCMYAKGEQVAIPGGRVHARPAPAYAAPPAVYSAPPPPPAYAPPPPPPGYAPPPPR